MTGKAALLAAGLFLRVRYGAAYGTAIDMSEFGTVRLALADAPDADGRDLLLYCCDTLERIAQSGDTDRARDFADAAHNLPACFDGSGAFTFDLGFWNEYIEPFRARYGDEYFAAFKDSATSKTRRSAALEKLRVIRAEPGASNGRD